MKSKLIAIAATAAALALPASAAGYGDAPTTVKAPGFPACSVTAYGPTFSSDLKSMTYGGGTSCQGGIGNRSLSTWEQVRGANGTWFTITGSLRTAGFTQRNPLRLFASRAAVLGHVYRTVARTTTVVPNGFAGCSLHKPPACNETITWMAISKPIAP